MKQIFKRSLSVFLAITIIFSSAIVGLNEVDFTGLFEIKAKAVSGTCGDNLTWSIENYTLTISGTGDMYNYTSLSKAPWFYYFVNKIVVEDGVTSIGDYAFHTDSIEIYLPVSVVKIGTNAMCFVDIYMQTTTDTVLCGYYAGTEEQFNNINKIESSYENYRWHYGTTEHTPEDEWKYVNSECVNEWGEAIQICREMHCIYCDKVLESENVGTGHIFTDNVCEVCGLQEFGYFEDDETMTATITDYYGIDSHLDIPEYINGYRITAIAESAFDFTDYRESESEDFYWQESKDEHVTEISIPKSVTSIGAFAFRGTGYYQNIENWASGCLYIDNCFIRANKSNDMLDSYYGYPINCAIVEGTRIIADGAFDYCYLTKKINIPASVESIGSIFFNNRKYRNFDDTYYGFQLLEFNVSSNNKYYSSEEGVLFNKDKTVLVKYPASKADKTYKVAENVTTLENDSFQSIYLEEISLGKYVDRISDTTFLKSEKLKRIEVSKENEYYSTADGVLFSKDKTVLECYPSNKDFSHYVVPDCVKTIDFYAFANCKLEAITLPYNIKYIQPYAFLDAYLRYVFYPGSSDKIQSDVRFGVLSIFSESLRQFYEGLVWYGKWHFNATDHTCGNWIIDKSATVYETGGKHKICSVCDDEVYYETIPQLKCDKAKLSKISNATSGVKITWGKVSGADSYRVYRKTKGGSWNNIGSIGKTEFTDKTAKSGTTYYYAVKVRNEAGDTDYSNSLSIKRLSVPKLSTVANTSSGVKVSWKKVTGASGYIVYRKTKSGDWKEIGKTSKLYYTDKKAKSGTSYYYSVRAYSGSVKSYYDTDGLSIRRLVAPKISSATSKSEGILIKWNKITGASGYYVYRKASSGEWKKIATVKGNTKIKYLDESPRKGATYQYRVKAYYSKSTSGNSDSYKIKCKY